MSQTIAELIGANDIADGVYLTIKETVDGEESNALYQIWGHNMHETDVDSVMVRRVIAPVARRMHSEVTTLYEGCEMDTWCEETWPARYSDEFLACVLTTPIIILSEDNEPYTIARKFFIPSYCEWGFTATSGYEDGNASPYATTNAKRIVYNSAGAAVIAWLRTRYSDTNYRSVHAGGSASNGTAASTNVYALPAFSLPSSLTVASEPNDDGSYTVILPDTTELPGIDYTVACDSGSRRYSDVKVNVTITGADATTAYATNNANDDEPTWEEITIGSAHTFENTEKTADEWGLAVRITAKGEATVKSYEPVIQWVKE